MNLLGSNPCEIRYAFAASGVERSGPAVALPPACAIPPPAPPSTATRPAVESAAAQRLKRMFASPFGLTPSPYNAYAPLRVAGAPLSGALGCQLGVVQAEFLA